MSEIRHTRREGAAASIGLGPGAQQSAWSTGLLWFAAGSLLLCAVAPSCAAPRPPAEITAGEHASRSVPAQDSPQDSPEDSPEDSPQGSSQASSPESPSPLGPPPVRAGSAPTGRVPQGPPTVERVVATMGTWATLELWAGDRAEGLAASEAALRALEETEARLSTWREDTDLARLNAAAPGVPMTLSPDTLSELERAFAVARQSGGAFDPGVGALVAAWGLRLGPEAPFEAPDAERLAALASALQRPLERRLTLGATAATRRAPDLVLEEGAFGKGAGLDRADAVLEALGIRRARIDLGGQFLLRCGEDEPFQLPLADPRDRGRVALQLTLASGALATTANSERALQRGSDWVGHVLDPRTARPAHEDDARLARASASAWCPRGLEADAWSTALFVLGPERGLALAERTPDLEALYLVPVQGADGAGALALLASPGLAGRIHSLASDVEPMRHLDSTP